MGPFQQFTWLNNTVKAIRRRDLIVAACIIIIIHWMIFLTEIRNKQEALRVHLFFVCPSFVGVKFNDVDT